MQRKHLSLTLAAACAALFAGCEWTSTSGSDSWSGSYDAMNFGGTYRISTVTLTSSSSDSDGTQTSTGNAADWQTVKDESGGMFQAGKKTASGKTGEQNLVPGSVKISCGDYIWVDNGAGGFTFGGGSSGGNTTGAKTYNKSDDCGKITNDKSYTHRISVMGQAQDLEIVPGSVSVNIGGAVAFQDDGAGTLRASGVLGSGSINYKSGVVAFTLDSTAFSGKKWSVAYQYTTTGAAVSSDVAGSGSILYASGAWSLVVDPQMPSTAPIRVTYSYYTGIIDGGGSQQTRLTGIDTTNFDPTSVSAITVTQTGQHLTVSFNNGIVMSGKFTSVRKTASVDTDTGAGADTYNAQFQVSSGSDSKLVGTLNYDYPSHNRMLDGTWTWGRKVFDVHAVGPAWNESGVTTAAEATVTTGK